MTTDFRCKVPPLQIWEPRGLDGHSLDHLMVDHRLLQTRRVGEVAWYNRSVVTCHDNTLDPLALQLTNDIKASTAAVQIQVQNRM